MLAWAAAGCGKPDAGGPKASLSEATETIAVLENIHLNHAQPKLKTMKLWLGANELVAEICTNQVQVATGMMFRTNLLGNEAMLFVFGVPHRASFYMKNTVVPLSAAYIDPDGIILEIHDLQPRNEQSVTAGTDRVQYVLETTQGWFKRHGVATGAVVRTEFGTLQKTFFPRRP